MGAPPKVGWAPKAGVELPNVAGPPNTGLANADCCCGEPNGAVDGAEKPPPPPPPPAGEPNGAAVLGWEKPPKPVVPVVELKAGAVAAAAAPNIDPPDAAVLFAEEPPKIEPAEAPKPPEVGGCVVDDPNILPDG